MSLKQDFNKYFDYLVKEGKLFSCTIKDLCYKCYCQGTTRISSKEVSIEEVEKWLENKEFFDFIESCISHPEQMKNECSNSHRLLYQELYMECLLKAEMLLQVHPF